MSHSGGRGSYGDRDRDRDRGDRGDRDRHGNGDRDRGGRGDRNGNGDAGRGNGYGNGDRNGGGYSRGRPAGRSRPEVPPGSFASREYPPMPQRRSPSRGDDTGPEHRKLVLSLLLLAFMHNYV